MELVYLKGFMENGITYFVVLSGQTNKGEEDSEFLFP